MAEFFSTRYDRAADTLYVTIPRDGAAHGVEDEMPGVYWRRLDDDESLIGVIVTGFEEYWKPRLGTLADRIANEFEVPSATTRRALERTAA